ncbi:porphobilinogen synthase [Deinococcus alpinitundrae]|uniref:porphobilinogen synthase n=1 Tax=Deinococcus alpinitundrae TaxID=468913 RepID=UPI00137B08C9|nr:porphobilinogen synthase [Deinococcus alpinitundrae]
MQRPRRLRRTPALRALTREIRLSAEQLILPLFVHEGVGDQVIGTMPGVLRHDLPGVLAKVQEAQALGIGSVILFGIPDHKDPDGSQAYAGDGIVQKAITEIKARFPTFTVIADTCLCEYTNHGHCGPLIADGTGGWTVDNDAALPLLAQTAVSQARAGADIVAPSAMMDGQVGAIRAALDDAGFGHVPVMAYAVKYASGYYGPFREAAGSTPSVGDRASYQMDPAGGYREALREARLDVAEGADYLMVKPALAYLDVIRVVKDAFELPMVAYNVSGEYAMLKAAALAGMLDEKRTVLETLVAFRRAGADAIMTYHALDAARWLQEEK